MVKYDKLITYAYMKDECDLPVHLPDIELETKIYRAQQTLRMLMCEAFYFDLIDKFIHSDTVPLTSEYAALMPYVKQYLAWQAHEYWIIRANFKYTLSGVRVHTEPNSTAATDVQMGILIKDAKYQAEYYKRLLVSYIRENSSIYPLYCNCGAGSVGNTFHVSSVRNKYQEPQPHGAGSFKNCNCND